MLIGQWCLLAGVLITGAYRTRVLISWGAYYYNKARGAYLQK